MTEHTRFHEDEEVSGIEFDVYGIKGKFNPAGSQADEPANWWGVLSQLNRLLMGFAVDVPGLMADAVRGLRNLVRAIGAVKAMPRDVERIAQAAQSEVERKETERESQLRVNAMPNESTDAAEHLIQVLQGIRAEGLHVEIVERPDGAIVIVMVRPEQEWQTRARKIAGYIPDYDEVIVKSLHEVGLPSRVIQCLEEAGFYSVGELVGLTDQELLQLPGIGRKSVEIIRQCIHEAGL